MRLWRSGTHPGIWIGEDPHGALVQWPASPKGWLTRTPYTGPRRGLEEVPPAEARGSGWPGGGTGKRPRTGGKPSRPVTIRASQEEREAWERAAAGDTLSEWGRRELNEAAERKRGRK